MIVKSLIKINSVILNANLLKRFVNHNLCAGMRNRSVGRHNMNDYSSRSHTILTVHITSEQQVSVIQFIHISCSDKPSGRVYFVKFMRKFSPRKGFDPWSPALRSNALPRITGPG